MRPTSSPSPRWATALLRTLLSAADRDVVLSELEELWKIRCAREGLRGARRWYVRQVLAFAWALMRWGRKRGVREHRSRFHYEVLRNQGGVDMTRWMREVAQGGRRLRRAPVFTLVAVTTIAVGIGAFTSIFSLVESVLLEPMPYDDPDELAWVWRDYVGANFPRGWLGGPDIAAFADHPDVFEDVVAFRTASFNLAGVGGEAPAQVVANQASAGFFEALGVPLQLGREWRPEEDVPEGPNVAVLSHALWRAQFGADPDVVGRTISLDGQSTEVIGVAPEGFRFVKHGSLVDPVEADLYTPLYTDLAAQNPGSGAYAALVRIPGEVHPDRVAAALAAAAEPYNTAFGRGDGGSTIRLWTVGLEEDLVAPVRPALAALFAAAAFLLLVLAANLATLLLGRAATREHELGVRLALGAGRKGVLASVVAETALIAGIGGALGVALSFLGTDLVVRLAPDDLPRLGSVGVDGSVLAVALAATAAMALAPGMASALHALRASVAATLKEGGARSGGSVGRARARSVLVGTQVALSLMLLVGAGLIAQAFAGLLRQNPGFDASDALTFRVPLAPSQYPDAPSRLAFHDELRARLTALPGVESVGAATALPLTLATNQTDIVFPGAPGNVGDELVDQPLIDWFRATPGYFTAAGFRLLAGRGFEALDADTTTFNIVIDDVLASQFFPNGSAVGARAEFFGDTATIVGVVDQARLYNVHADDRGQVYIPFQRFPTASMSYVVRASVEPNGLAPSARGVLAELDASLPMANVRSLEEIVDASLGQQRLSLTLVVAFALGALLLATLGIYGVVSNAVVRRTREIGLRMALGADPSTVVVHVLRQGLVLAVAGALVGLVGAAATSRALSSVVVGVDPTNPLVYAAVALGLVAVAAIASYLPARRATRIDPLAALTPE